MIALQSIYKLCMKIVLLESGSPALSDPVVFDVRCEVEKCQQPRRIVLTKGVKEVLNKRG